MNKRAATFCGHTTSLNTMLALEYLYFAPRSAPQLCVKMGSLSSRGAEEEAPSSAGRGSVRSTSRELLLAGATRLAMMG